MGFYSVLTLTTPEVLSFQFLQQNVSGISSAQNSAKQVLTLSLKTFSLHEGTPSHVAVLPCTATLFLLSVSNSFESSYT